jgi:hypothetical protein
LLAVQPAQAALSFYEPFSTNNFTGGASLGKNEANGWSIGNSPSAHGSSVVGGAATLNYEGLQTDASSLGVVRAPNTTESSRNVGKPFDTAFTNGPVYCSFLVQAVTLPTTNRCVLSLNQSTGGNGFASPAASVWVDAAGRLLIGKNSSNSAPETTAALGDKTAFVVLKYTFNPGADDDEVALYLAPKPGQPEPAKPTLATTNGADIKKLVAFGLPQGRPSDSTHGAGTGELYLDEIRVGDTWADVTPAAEAKK